MDEGWNKRSGYIGEPPSRPTFGRKAAPVEFPRDAGSTLSEAPQPPREVHFSDEALVNDIDFSIGGGDMQFVEIELDPGEAVVAEPGSMIWKDSAVVFDATLGDGSDRHAGLGSKLVNAGMNMLSGESLFVAEFRHEGKEGKAKVALGGRIPGHIIPVRLDAMGGSLICQRKSFLAAAKGVAISISMQRKFGSAILGEEGFIMQRLTGRGWAFLHVGGSIIERELQRGEIIHVDGGCVAAHEPEVEMDIDTDGFFTNRLKGAVFGGESFFLTTLRGPGKVWLQSLPFTRVAAETAAAAPVPAASKISDGIDLIDGINKLQKLF